MNSSISSRDLLLSKSFQEKINNDFKKEYRNFIEDIRSDLEEGFTTDIIDPQFIDQLSDIVQDENLDFYSGHNFYWLSLIDNLIYLIQLHEEILNQEEYNESNENFSDNEAELIEFWNNTEFAETFTQILESGLPAIEASDQLIPLFENQIISFYVLHINQFQQFFDDAIIYQPISELGDSEKRIFLANKYYLEFKEIPEGFPSLAIKKYNPDEKEIILEINEKDISYKLSELNSQIEINKSKFKILADNNEDFERISEIRGEIFNSLKNLFKNNSDLFFLVSNFIDTIILTNNNDFLSFSIDSLPGICLINHHKIKKDELANTIATEAAKTYLAKLKYIFPLVKEETELSLYSPWSMNTTNINQLFDDLFLRTVLIDLDLNCFELIKLSFALEKIKQASQKRLLTKNGFDTFTAVSSRLESKFKNFEELENKLSQESLEKFDELQKLKNDLMNF